MSPVKKAAEAAVEKPQAEHRLYEVMFILNPDLPESKSKKKFKDFETFVEQSGGKVTHTDLWGRRKLAYHIGQFSEGVYGVYNISLDPAAVTELNQYMRIDPEVIRHLVISLAEGYQYQVYKEEEKTEEEKPKSHHKPEGESGVSIKHSAAPRVKKEPTEEKKEEKKPAVSEDVLDAKLDQILGGEDLNF